MIYPHTFPSQELARLTTPRSGNQYMTLLDDQFKRLEEYCTIHITHDKSEFKTTHGSSGVNHTKNRFSNVLPCKFYFLCFLFSLFLVGFTSVFRSYRYSIY